MKSDHSRWHKKNKILLEFVLGNNVKRVSRPNRETTKKPNVVMVKSLVGRPSIQQVSAALISKKLNTEQKVNFLTKRSTR